MGSEVRFFKARNFVLVACAVPALAMAGAIETPTATQSAGASAKSEERFLVQILVTRAPLHETPDADAPVIGQVEQGTQLEADQRRGEWYRVLRAGAEPAWILNAPTPTGTALAVSPFPAGRRIDTEAARRDPRAPESLPKEKLAKRDEPDVERRRPQGERLEPRLPLIETATLAVHVGFEDISLLHHLLPALAAAKRAETFDADGARIVVELPVDQVDALKTRLRDATRDRARFDD